MRKYLLASAAMLGATVNLAHAQLPAANPSQGQFAAPYGAGPAVEQQQQCLGYCQHPDWFGCCRSIEHHLCTEHRCRPKSRHDRHSPERPR